MNPFSNLRGGGRIVLGLALGLVVVAGNPAHAADKIVLQLNWKHQAEYAGYYVAQEKGWYADEGLEVEIRPAMPTDDMVALLVAGEADVIVEFMASALYEREQGAPIVNIAQPFKHTGLDLICRRDSGLRLLDDLRGKKIGHAPGHGETVELGALLAKLDINAKSSIDATSWNPKTDVRLVEFENAQYGITSGIVDCILWYSSKGLGVFESAGLRADQLIVFPFDGLGLGILGGGLWVLEKRLEDAVFVDTMARFVHVSMKGWRWAEDNQAETVSMVLKTMGDQSPQALLQQTQMMKAIINQAADSNGTLEARDYRRTVDILRDGMVLDKEPQNAWTSDITDRANLYAGDRFDRLLTDVAAWSKRFVLTLIDPRSTLAHICWFLLVLSMFMHNFTTLRILVVVSSFVSIANDMFLRFDYATMFWTVFLILPNLWHLFFAKVADAMAKLTAEEEDLWVSQLQGLSRKNCHKLFNSGQWAFAGGGEEIARYGHPISHIYYIYGGAIVYSRDDKIISRVEAPTFANLFSFLDMAPSFMVTNIEKGTRYWVIEVDVLRKLMHNNDDIGRSLDKVFGAQFRKYGRVMSNRILELEERLNSDKTGASIHKTADTKHAAQPNDAVKFSPDEAQLHTTRLVLLSKVNCRKLLKKGRWGIAEKGMMMAIQGQLVSDLYFISSDGCTVTHDGEVVGRVNAPIFYGQQSITTLTPSGWSVEADEGTRYWAISASNLRDFMVENMEINRVLGLVFHEDTHTCNEAILQVQMACAYGDRVEADSPRSAPNASG